MNQFLLGRLSAIAMALGVETAFLMSEDGDAHIRLDKLIEALEKLTGEMIAESNNQQPDHR
jgi:hypothetical protein